MQRAPPDATARLLTALRPRPVPPVAALVLKKGSVARAAVSCDMPRPSSSTVKTA